MKALDEDDELRANFLRACLTKLGLVVSQESSSVPSLSRIHLSSLRHFLIPELLSSWEDIIVTEDGEEYIKGGNDTFHIEKQESRWSLGSLAQSLPIPGVPGTDRKDTADQLDGAGGDRILDYDQITKKLIPHEVEWPSLKETPYFNHHSFYSNLQRYQRERSSEAEVSFGAAE